MRSRLFIWIN